MALRTSARCLAEKMSSDPWLYHEGSKSPFWDRVRKALVVNPDSVTGMAPAPMHRYPPPASRPEPYARPASKASDVAQNAYFERDARRNYPQTAVITQGDLSALLIAQPEGLALPPITHAAASADKDARALTTAETAPSLSELYLAPSSSASSTFLPPTPVPTAGDYVPRKYTMRPAPRKNQPPSSGYFPMTLYT